MEKIYIVVYTGGDWLGYHETKVLGCFHDKEEALKCKESGLEPDLFGSNSQIIIEECELR